MSTSSGSRVRRDGTIATSSNPYALRAVFPAPISSSMRLLRLACRSPIRTEPETRNAHPGKGGRHGPYMPERYQGRSEPGHGTQDVSSARTLVATVGPMEQRVSLITLGVADLARSEERRVGT